MCDGTWDGNVDGLLDGNLVPAVMGACKTGGRVAASIGLAEGTAVTEGDKDEDIVGALVGLPDGN